LVAWFKHVAVPAAFILDKGAKHIVAAGIDYRFLNNYFIPYNPKRGHDHMNKTQSIRKQKYLPFYLFKEIRYNSDF